MTHDSNTQNSQQPKYNFKADLAEGQEQEKEFIQFLLTKYGVRARRNESSNLEGMRKYDVADQLGHTYEIKFDRKWQETGNVYLEHKAIVHSEADYIVYKLDTFYSIPRLALVQLLKHNHKLPKWKEVQGGEFGDWGTLLPVSEFLTIFNAV